ncbi:MAG: hypothetical protein FWD03_03155 [Defluviitaleaceae bacterium]|nr:hypothetical protein [Defluviitaleaceae bacterium]
MKKILAVLLLTALMVYMSMPVMAYDYYQETLGEAILREDGLLLVSGFGLTEDSLDEVLLYIEEAEIYDLRTGFAVGAEAIYEGDCVRVVYEVETDGNETGHALARALEIYVHAGEQDAADFMVVVSDNIWYSDEGCVFVTIDGKYRVTLDDDTMLLDAYGYEMSYDDIVPGMEMFVWAATVTASFPGQVVPDKIVLLN